MADPSYETLDLVIAFCMGDPESLVDSDGRTYDISAIHGLRRRVIELDRLEPDGVWVTIFTGATPYEVAVEVERLGLRRVLRRRRCSYRKKAL